MSKKADQLVSQIAETDVPARGGPFNGQNLNVAPTSPTSPTSPKGSRVLFADGSSVDIPPAEEHAKPGAHGMAGAEATSHAVKRSVNSPYNTPLQSPA